MKSCLNIWFTSLLLIATSVQALSQYTIKGQLIDSESKYSFIVLEYLPSIYGLNSTVMDNFVNKAKIDSNGYFSMSGNSLPKDERLYRLALLNDTALASIHTGHRKNFIHIELGPTSHFEIIGCDDISITFENCIIEGSPTSQIIQSFYDQLHKTFIEDRYKMEEDKSELKEQLLNQNFTEKIKRYCDTSTHLNAALIAYTHLENRSTELKYDPDFFERFSKKITSQDAESPYVIEIKNEIASHQEIILGPKKDYSKYIIAFMSLSIIGLSLYTYSLKKRLSLAQRESANLPAMNISEKIESLSKKELEVYQLIVAGKSNKEIASTLYIETTTVKSHISKVYQKIGVKNRKEAILISPKKAV